MRQRFLDTGYLARFEEQVTCETRTKFADRDWRWATVADELMKLLHFEGDTHPATTPVGALQSNAQIWYAQLPYTVLSVWRLWRTGYYLEAFVLLRHLFEVLVQVQYFYRHPEKLEAHISARGRRDQGHVSFKTMFEEICPGIYEVLYAFLSSAAHGTGTMIFRAHIDAASGRAQRLTGTVFSWMWADGALSLLTAAVRGFLSTYFVVFPKNTVGTDELLLEDVSETRAWLKALTDQPGERGAPAADFYKKLEPLMDARP